MNTSGVLRGVAVAVVVLFFASNRTGAQGMVIDHTCTSISQVPASAIQQARSTLHIAYGHTSHGSQLVTGMSSLVAFMNLKKDDAFPENAFTFNSGGTGGALDLRDTPFSSASDLGNPNRIAWAAATRTYLNANPAINVIIWSWCGQVDGSEADINTYLTLMSQLEADYPNVKFVYMTGHLTGTGTAGNVNVRNNQIRAFCRANAKILYDFADIESFDPDGAVNYMEKLANDNCDYDSDGNGSLDRNWATAWEVAHTQNLDWYSCSAAHSQSLNGNRKAYAAWWLWARLAGWSGSPANPARVSIAPDAALPATLSAVGAFSDLANLAPAAGFVAYQPILPSWADGAQKRFWAATPSSGVRATFAASSTWTLPVGFTWVQHFDLETVCGDAASRRRIETRLLVRTADGVLGVSYRWNDAQTDATLVPEAGAEVDFTVCDGGVNRTQRWRFPARSACLQCHTAAVGYAPSFNTRQLNRTVSTTGGASANQLTALAAAGILDSAPASPGLLATLPRCTDAATPLETRARAWLHANCASCHQPGGTTTATFDARCTTSLAQTGLLDGVAQNNLGDPATRLIRPDHPEQSAVALRVASTGTARMPPARSEVDPLGVILVTEWVHRLAQPADAQEGLLVNLSTRGIVQGGDSVMIGGFVISGSTPKQLLLRGIGPTLEVHGVGAPLGDPQIELFRGNTSLGSNDNWGSSPDAAAIAAAATATGAFALAPDSRDAAMLVTLVPGAYTVHVRGAAGSNAVGMFEAYEVGGGAGSRLVNLSTRLRIGTGERVAIPGLVVDGDTRRTFLVRAVGPALAAYGVVECLANPRLTVMDGSAPVAANDDWGSPSSAAVATAAQALGAFPLPAGSRDAALLITLDPGIYTVITEGASAGEGVVLVEIYEVL
jgi:hypothetical protein